MAIKRVTRKQLLKEPDEFFTLTGRVLAWVKAHPRQLTMGAAVLAAAVLIVSGYRFFNERSAREASRLLSQGLETYRQQMESQDPAKALEAVQADFDELVKAYRGQPAGRLGHIYYGQILLAAQKTREALALLEQARDDFDDDPALANIIFNNLAAAYLQSGDKAAAMAQYEKIVSGANATHKDTALFQLGVLYLESDQAEKGRQMLKQLGEDFPDSTYAEMAREKIAG